MKEAAGRSWKDLAWERMEDMSGVNGERVIEGARHLSPYLGDRMIAAQVFDRLVFVRELLPQDMKAEIKRLTQDEARKVAEYLALVIGKAHARQMDVATRKLWKKELQRNRTKNLDAPSWLWPSVVELVALHEGGQLSGAFPQMCEAHSCYLSHTLQGSQGLSESG